MSLKPICVGCQRFYRPKKTGYYFLEGMPKNNDTKPGKPEEWSPYKLWGGDLWECPGCGHRIISGTGMNPVAVQHEPTFAKQVERLGADFMVLDC